MSILAFAEQRNNQFRKPAFEAVSTAKRLADETGKPVAAVVVGDKVDSIAADLGKYGMTKVFIAQDAALANYSTEGYTDAVCSAIEKSAATTVILPASAMGKDLAPRVAARLKAGLASDVTAIDVDGNRLVITRPVMAGKAFQKLVIKSDKQVISTRPNVFKAVEKSATAKVESLSLALKPVRAVVKETVVESSKKVELTEADVIVSGGRGLKGPDNWNLITELAEALGGAQGASRAVVDAGWRPHEEQVGQTGKTVSPALYIAVGISGAIQHLAGMSSSKTIVAINNDPEAPIFKIADYGLIGDALEVLPELAKQVMTVKSH